MIKKKFSDALQFVKERYVAKKIRKIVGSGEQGFTLLEILVVLTIMGFLIAMVAPRLAGISGDAVDTVCDSNQNRMVTYLASYVEKKNCFPSKLTNLVDQIGTGYQLAAVSDDNPDNGAESIAKEFMDRNHFRIHYLNAAEANELKKLGIVSVFNLNQYSAYTEDGAAVKQDENSVLYDITATGPTEVALLANAGTKLPVMNPVIPAAGVGVAMVGCGVATAAGTDFAVATANERGWGEPDFFGRMVFGMGAESSLVKDGIISNAAHCPGGIQNSDNVLYNDYNVVLPRLSATATRMSAADAITDMDTAAATGDPAGVQLDAVAYDKDPEDGEAYDMATNVEALRKRQVTITEEQAIHQYATMCPEGHMYPEDDAEFWGVDLNHDDSLAATP